jgi:hypothetical protein
MHGSTPRRTKRTASKFICFYFHPLHSIRFETARVFDYLRQRFNARILPNLWARIHAGHFDARYQILHATGSFILTLEIVRSCLIQLDSLRVEEHPILRLLTLHHAMTMMMVILGTLGCCIGSVVAAHQEHLILGSSILFG